MTIRSVHLMLLPFFLSGACAAEKTSWVFGFAKAIASQAATVPNNLNLSMDLLPYVVFDAQTCATARLPTAASQVPITSAVISFQNADACNVATPLAVLQFYIEASSAAQIAEFKSALAGDLPAPCFIGQSAQADTRRHAPPRLITAWRTSAEVIVLASEQGIDDAVALSLLARTSNHDVMKPGVEELRHGIENGLPAACL